MMDMLRIADLHVRFGDKEVLRGLNLTVPEHSIYGFIGKNGAGKTSTMKTVLGLLKADSGEIFVNGKKMNFRNPSDAMAAGIGMVQQHFMLFEDLTVAENLFSAWKWPKAA